MKEILYSPGYGAGWASWNDDPFEKGKFLAEYKPLVEWAKTATPGKKRQMSNEDHETTHPLLVQLQADLKAAGFEDYVYYGGLDDIEVMEIPDGVGYKIDEYDGYESVILQDRVDWW